MTAWVWVIDVVYHGVCGMVKEDDTSYQFVLSFKEATKYPNELQAKTAAQRIDAECKPVVRAVRVSLGVKDKQA